MRSSSGNEDSCRPFGAELRGVFTLWRLTPPATACRPVGAKVPRLLLLEADASCYIMPPRWGSMRDKAGEAESTSIPSFDELPHAAQRRLFFHLEPPLAR